jgi:hypothetical protein
LEGPEGGLFWTENRIKYHASFLNLIIESLPNPFYVIDTSDYTIKIANSASKFDQFLKGSTCYALIHKNDQPCNSAEHPCPIETIRKTKKPMTVEHVHFDKDGNRRNVEIHAFPIFDSDANVTQIAEYVSEEKTRPGEILVTQPVKDNLGDKLHISSHWIDSLKGTGNTVIYRVLGIKEL